MEDTVSEQSDIMPSGTDADLQEQGNAGPSGDGGGGTAGGTGGSEADLQEQVTVVRPADARATDRIAGEGTGGSEADRLEQAADVPLDGDDAYPHGGAGDDDSPTA